MDELILMKLYTIVLYNLRMCLKGNNPGTQNIQEDNSREIIILRDRSVLCNLTHSSSESLKLPILPDLFCEVFVHCGFYCIFFVIQGEGRT